MKILKICFIVILLLVTCGCDNKESKELKKSLQKEYSSPHEIKKLSSGIKAQYIQMEGAINKRYVKNLDSLINHSFDIQLARFEDRELGIWNGYMNMFAWIFKSREAWEEELILIGNKYFNNLDIQQSQYELYQVYTSQIKELRDQFIFKSNLPSYTPINLPSEEISIESLISHSGKNLGGEIIDLSADIFLELTIVKGVLIGFLTWLLGLIGITLSRKVLGIIIGVILFLLGLIGSIIYTNHNDNILIKNLKDQHEQTVSIDTNLLLQNLNNNTIHFYEKI